MKFLAVSDTHGDRQILVDLLHQQPGLAAYFYAGDAELPASDDVFATYQPVRGNMDFDNGFPLALTRQLGSTTVWLTHGHRYGANLGVDQLLAAGQTAGADVILYGHTHQLFVAKRAGVLIVNPGSISQPRGEFADLGGTYAVISITGPRQTVDFFDRQGRRQTALARQFD